MMPPHLKRRLKTPAMGAIECAIALAARRSEDWSSSSRIATRCQRGGRIQCQDPLPVCFSSRGLRPGVLVGERRHQMRSMGKTAGGSRFYLPFDCRINLMRLTTESLPFSIA